MALSPDEPDGQAFIAELRAEGHDDAADELERQLDDIERDYQRNIAETRRKARRMKRRGRRQDAQFERLFTRLARRQARPFIAQARRPACEVRAQRAPRAKPVRRRGSRRTTSRARSPGGDGDPDADHDLRTVAA